MSSPVKNYYLGLIPHSCSHSEKSYAQCIDGLHFTQIINNADLFWVAYCKAALNIEHVCSNRLFHISVDRRTSKFTITGLETIIDDIKMIIEAVRASLVHQNEVFIKVNIPSSSCQIKTCSDKYVPFEIYWDYVMPVLPQLAVLLSASYKETDDSPAMQGVHLMRLQLTDVSA